VFKQDAVWRKRRAQLVLKAAKFLFLLDFEFSQKKTTKTDS